MSQAGWLLCGKLSSICAEGTPEKVSEGEARCSQGGGQTGSLGRGGGISYASGCKCPPTLPGIRKTLPVPLPGDKKG